MGFQDTLTRLGGQQGQEGGLASIQKLLNSSGGLQGIASKLTSGGLGKQVQSWVGHGDNQPVTGNQIREAMDPATLNQVAQQAGMTPEEASNHVAQVLPEMVDQATPEGQLPAEDPFSKGLGAMKQMLRR